MKPVSERALLTLVSESLFEKEGAICLRLKGNCMWPVLRDGDKLFIEKKPFAALKAGDVAVFRTSAETFHANTCFRGSKPGEPSPEGYLGAVTEIFRKEKRIVMSGRSKIRICAELACSPANPYGLSLCKTLARIFFKQEARRPRR